jgi:hypothetical protein
LPAENLLNQRLEARIAAERIETRIDLNVPDVVTVALLVSLFEQVDSGTVPPGVDIDRFVLQDRGAALEDLLAEARRGPPNGGDERLPDDGNAQRLAAFLDGLGPLVVTSGS